MAYNNNQGYNLGDPNTGVRAPDDDDDFAVVSFV
jgi:hypothetical protein